MYNNYQLNLGKGKNYQIQIIKGENLSYLGSFGISSFSDGLRFAEYDVFKPTIFLQIDVRINLTQFYINFST